MKRFIQGEHRGQGTLLPESLDDYVSDTNPVRVVDVFVDELDLVNLRFDGAIPADTGRPAYHPSVLLKIYIYGYLNRIQSSRRLEREAQPQRRADVADRAFVASSSCSVSSWDCLEKILLPSMAVNSRLSTIVIAISPAPN